MTELVTAAQMRAIEKAAIDSGRVTGLELMERAGQGVVAAIFEEWPELKATSHRAVVLCGPGNNGGDGFVVARLLKEWGWEVRVLAATGPEAMPADAGEMARRWRKLGPVEPLTEAALWSGTSADIYVDAVFGTGLGRPPIGEIGRLLAYLGGSGGGWAFFRDRLVAVDGPSCLCLDSGRDLMAGGEFRLSARLTVTFDSRKPGHVLAEGPEMCGKVVVVDIGVEPWRDFENPRRSAHGWGGAWKRKQLGLVGPMRAGDVSFVPGQVGLRALSKAGRAGHHLSHKFTHGHALILGGPSGRGGAARLAARGALRIGAGLVTVGCPADARAENAARLDAVMLREMADATALAGALEDGRINALCLGPGMGTGAREAGLVGMALARDVKARPCRNLVLDADALTILSQTPDIFAALHTACVLTPHAGEFARLFPDIAAKLAEPAHKGRAYSKVDATRAAAKRAGCVVLFKGPDTVIADPSGHCAINAAAYDRAAPWLATAGSGDVLAGFITGLLARGFSPFDAACTGAWLHVECARSFGPGLIAEDLPEELPKVFRALGL